MHTMHSALTSALAHPPAGMEALRLNDNPRLDPLQHIIRALAVTNEGRLLVVCPRAHELSPLVRDAERVVVWSDPEVRTGLQRMPASVVGVVFVSMPGHRGAASIYRQAKQLNAQLHHGTVTTRTVDELCEAAGLITATGSRVDELDDVRAFAERGRRAQLAVNEVLAAVPDSNPNPNPNPNPNSPDESDPDMAKRRHKHRAAPMKATAHFDPRTGRTKAGSLKEFIREHADLTQVPATRELDRLFKLATAEGIPTTKGSLSESYYSARRGHGINGSVTRAAKATTKPAPTTTPAPTPAPPTRAVAAPIAVDVPALSPLTMAPETVLRDVAALNALCDDGLTALGLIKDAIGAMTPVLAELFSKQAETSALHAKLINAQRAFALAFNDNPEPGDVAQ